MKLYYGGAILTGLVIFLALVTAPFWLNAATPTYKQPELQKPAPPNDKYCVEDTEFMRTSHMKVLDDWRDWAIRDGQRTYVSTSGRTFTISLQNTCMKCHTSKEKFCDKCHNDAAVSPYCWDCHIAPVEKGAN